MVYSEDRKDGGSYSYRFHGHFGHKAVERVLNDALQHQSSFLPAREEAISTKQVLLAKWILIWPRGSSNGTTRSTLQRLARFAAADLSRNSLILSKEKMPQRQRSAKLSDSALEESSNTSVMTYI